MPETVTGWGAALWGAVGAALSAILGFLPNLIGAIIILLIGWGVAVALGKLTDTGLEKIGFDRAMERAGINRALQRANLQMDASGVVGSLVKWLVFLVAIIVAADALNLPQVTAALNAIIGYIPNVIAAIFILALGALLASFVGNLVRSTPIARSDLLGTAAYWAIVVFAVMAALTQLNIAPELVQTLFTALIGAVALAAALAFGLGLREQAQDVAIAQGLRQVLHEGDEISVSAEGKQVRGEVKRIGLGMTQLATEQGLTLVPNRWLAQHMLSLPGASEERGPKMRVSRMQSEIAAERTKSKPGQPPD